MHSTKTEAYNRVVMFTIKAEQQLITLRADGMDWKRVAEEFGVFSKHEDLERVMMAIEKVSQIQLIFHYISLSDFHD